MLGMRLPVLGVLGGERPTRVLSRFSVFFSRAAFVKLTLAMMTSSASMTITFFQNVISLTSFRSPAMKP